MKILISYSRDHFDPHKSPAEHTYWDSSANIIARTIYELAQKMGEVTYIDPSEHATVSGQGYDLFISQIDQFETILKRAKIKRSLLVAVNMHPVERNKLLRAYVRDHELPAAAFSPADIVEEVSLGRAITQADMIVAVGNMAVYNSYIRNGVPRTKIKMINYGVGPAAKRTAPPKPQRFLYVASEIGLRKGFDSVFAAAVHAAETQPDFRLDIVGTVSNPFYQARLDELVSRFPQQIIAHGWVASSSEPYQKLLQQATYLLYPSLEEGQAGTVLDAMRHGVIPIVSSASGVDFSPLGWFEPTDSPEAQSALIDQAVALEPSEITPLQQKTLEYYRLYHQDFVPALAATLKRAASGTLYPRFSITLAIFNKAKTIEDLLSHIDRAARAYRNVELHIIFDGCKDETESITRRFYRSRTDYPVTYETTPDIFEVKTNNLGLRKSTGEYCMIIQDDNFVYDTNIFFEAATFLDKNEHAVVLGCLAGVNYYPRGTTDLHGSGQIAISSNEVYWRQDATTDPILQHKIFQVDACMRGPLIIRRSFMEEYGYLDEAYVPFYNDDTDICFRAASLGFQVYAMLSDVENKSLTVANYDAKRNDFWERTMLKNSNLFYSRWTPSMKKDYAAVTRILPEQSASELSQLRLARTVDLVKRKAKRAARDPLGALKAISKRARR